MLIPITAYSKAVDGVFPSSSLAGGIPSQLISLHYAQQNCLLLRVCGCVCKKEGRNYAAFQSDPRATKLFLLMLLRKRVQLKGGWVDKLDLYGYFCLMKCVLQGSKRQTERITQSLITRQGHNQYGKGFISELLIHHWWSLSLCRWQGTPQFLIRTTTISCLHRSVRWQVYQPLDCVS